MKNNFAYLLFLFLIPVSCNRDILHIENLRCEYLQDPLSIESQEPLLSWQLKSKQNGKNQTAYRILVASEPSLLEETKADYWDSGIVPSSQSVQVKYKGKPLSSRQQVYWKVKVLDENGGEIPWSKTATWTMGLLDPSDWKARWIASMEDTLPDSTLTWPAPYFRKEFTAKRSIKQAKAYVCGLGFYEMYLNGTKVGDQVLAPAVTNYDEREIQNILYFYDDQSTRRVLYNTFDVAPLLQKGDNTVGVILGNGWYNQRDRTIEGCMWYDTPRLLLQLEIEYDDGSREIIQTDPSWKCTTGPLLHDAIFTGEIYDARLELGEWNRNGYDDSGWGQALLVRAPTGVLRSQLAPFDKVTRILTPDFNGKKNDSTYLFTLPEMISGWAGITVKGKAGDKVKLRFIGEEDVDFGQFDTYILKGEGMEHWEPRFTWHAFRFIEVITKDVEMNAQSLVVKVVNTDPAKAGTFECSNEIFNAVNKAYILTQEGNFHGSVSSDCPHRERLAYTGDGQVIVESSILSFDMTQFYRKWFDDMDDARNKKTGYVPHTAPFGGGGGGPAWGSAYLIMPWAYFCYYGDTLLLKQHYHGMKQWVEYLKTRTDENGIVVREEPNGWCLGDWCTPDKVQIPEPLVNTAYYYHSADLIAKIAAVLSEKEDHFYFTQLAAQIKADFNRTFFNPETNHYWEGRQGADVFPLAFGMVPEENKEAVFNALLGHLKAIGDHFDTGILGTPLLLKVLTENGRMDVAYRIMNQQDAPGYSYLLDDKYSCLWERWNGKASRNHPMFGSVVAWFYNSLAGIRFDEENPGMKHMIIAPHPVDELTFCKASYQSLYGTVRSEWEQTPDKFELTVEIPANTTATVHVPDKFNGGAEIVEVSSGIYRFSVKKAY